MGGGLGGDICDDKEVTLLGMTLIWRAWGGIECEGNQSHRRN